MYGSDIALLSAMHSKLVPVLFIGFTRYFSKTVAMYSLMHLMFERKQYKQFIDSAPYGP